MMEPGDTVWEMAPDSVVSSGITIFMASTSM
jgi:hypothetical protein